MTKKSTTEAGTAPGLEQATGAIDYKFTNDFMFHSILQQRPDVLTALICSLLHLQEKDVTSVEIRNPIVPGKTPTDKQIVLDVNILLNRTTILNLEMQVLNEQNWDDRSLLYLCRSFDRLNSGDDYVEAKPVIHIGFLDFTLFPESPEFYAVHKLMNIKNHHLYSDKFVLSVVDLKSIHLATEEDQFYHIDEWAKLFKATTWEEVHMIAETNPVLYEASKALYTLNADPAIREECEKRADYYRMINSKNRKIENQEATIRERDSTIAEQKSTIAEQNSAIQTLRVQNEEKDSIIQALQEQNERHESEIRSLHARFDELSALLDTRFSDEKTSESS